MYAGDAVMWIETSNYNANNKTEAIRNQALDSN